MKNPLKQIFYAKLDSELRGCKRVLDLGCGHSSILERLSGHYYSVGVDAFAPYLEESRRKGIHDEYILSDILTIDFPEKSFDAIICFEVLEHLTEADGIILIKKLERWARKKILLSTPNGFISQGEYDGNELQEHKSGWTPRDLRALGFSVMGLEGLKSLARNRNGVLNFLWRVSFPAVFFTPSLSWRLFAVKTIS